VLKRLLLLLTGSLRRQLVVGMVAGLTLAMSLFVWDQTRRQQDVLVRQQTNQAIVLARSVATSGAVWVASRDYGGLQGIVESIAGYPDLTYAIVLDERGQVLAHTDASRIKSYLTELPKKAEVTVFEQAVNFTDVASPVMLAGHHFGWVRIGLDNTAIGAKLTEAAQSGALFALVGISLSCLLALMAGGFMTRRLGAIAKIADAVETGQTDLRVELNGDDEAACLARQFNHMLDALAYQSEKLKQGTAEIRALIDAIPDLIFTNHRDGTYLAVNAADPALLVTSPEDFLGRKLEDVLPQPVAELFMKAIADALDLREVQELTYSLCIDQREVFFEARVVAITQETVMSMVRDTTERKKAEDTLRRSANVFTHAREGIMITTAQGVITDINEAFTLVTGYSRDDVLGRTPHLLNSGRQSREFYDAMWHTLHERGHWSGEVWNRRKNGEVFAEIQNISAVCNDKGEVVEYVSLFSDITAIKLQQQQLEHMAHYDILTGLPNRILLADRLQQAMAQSLRRGQSVVVAYLDLDGFKAVNDAHGHDTGDQLLIAVTDHMKQVLRDVDTLARIGGDEFVAILVDMGDKRAIVPMLERLLKAASQTLELGALRLQVTASVGITFYPQAQEVDGDQLVRQADQAMYTAKLSGRNRYHIFDTAHDYSLRDHFRDIERIRLALSEHEFVLHYQPKVNMRTGTVVGVEALIRWQHPEHGLLTPSAFLPLIENDGLAIEIGQWVVDTALTQIETWQATGLDLAVSVNVGALQLQQDNFIEHLRSRLTAHPSVKPSRLELEILETSALEDVAKVSQLIESCTQLGVTFALDDFGTGYSSLTYLRRLRVAVLKIDQSFVRDMINNAGDLAILQGVIGLAASFKRQVIAEGVETVAHGSLLLQMGCELAQGYGIAKPMPAAQVPSWVAAWQPDPEWSRLPLSIDDE
jgi:diguanylate cyclase (GGDEF)-like protein/PAS domain S-box-containing protein